MLTSTTTISTHNSNKFKTPEIKQDQTYTKQLSVLQTADRSLTFTGPDSQGGLQPPQYLLQATRAQAVRSFLDCANDNLLAGD